MTNSLKKKKGIPGIKRAKKSKYDSAWKTVIRELFKDFLEFFYPEIYRAIDFEKGSTFLDKELTEIDPGSDLGDRVADVLVKVHLHTGDIRYISIIIHIEVQGQARNDFMDRMFIYYYRAFDKEKKERIPVISLAILTDDDENFRPCEHEFKLFGFEVRMKIPVVKIKKRKPHEHDCNCAVKESRSEAIGRREEVRGNQRIDSSVLYAGVLP
jgi:hypothetical protein